MIATNRLSKASVLRALWLICVMIFLGMKAGFPQLPSNLRTQYIPANSEISSNSIIDIAQDRNGFIWLATSNGLNRFDGKNYKIFRKNFYDTNSIIDNSVTRLAVDKKNRLWIGYRGDGISCYDQLTNKFTHFFPDSANPQAFPFGETSVLFIDSKNTLWFSAGKNGLYRLDIETGKVKQIVSELPFLDPTKSKEYRKYYNLISEIIEGEGDTLWMATGDGFYSFNRRTNQFQVYRMELPGVDSNKWKPDVFHTIVRTSPKDFYLGGWERGLNHYDAETKKWTNYPIKPDAPRKEFFNIIGSVQRKSENELWVTSYDTTLSVFNTEEKKFHHLTQEQINNNMLAGVGGGLFTDASGDLWITLGVGIFLINQSNMKFHFTDLHVSRSDNGRVYYATSVMKDSVTGSLLINTAYADGFHIIRKDGSKKIIPYSGPIGTPFQFGGEIFKDSRGTIWVLSSEKVHIYDRQTESLLLPKQPVPDTSFRSAPYFHKATEDKDGCIWFATYRQGVYKYDPRNETWKQYFHAKDGRPSALPGNYVTAVVADKDGDVWVCHDKEGISRFRYGTGKIEKIRAVPGNMNHIPDDRTLCAQLDSKGRIWLGTFHGLSVIDPSVEPPIVNNFVHDQDFLGMLVHDMIIDRHDRVWTLNSNGVSVLDYDKQQYRTFNYEHGLPKNEYLSFSRGLGDEIYASALKGYYTFSDTIAVSANKPEKVMLTSFKVGERQVLFDDELLRTGTITLNSGEDLFTAEFISVYYKNTSAIDYRYRLKGIDNDWKWANKSGYVSYNNLPGGSYTLELQANLAGEFSEITSIPIFIETPFYKTSWFRLLLIASFATLIFTLYRYRVSHIEKTEALKTALNKQIAETEMKALRAQMNPHFIFNCLNSINRYIIKNDHKTASLYLTKFAKLIRLILDNSEHHEVELAQELEALKLYIDIEALRFDHKFSYEIEVDDEIDQDSIKIPAMVIQPFVENAIWHGLLHKDTHGKMMIRVKLDGELLVCEVEDDGVGREKAMELKSKTATTRKSLGLKITADRLEALESRFGVPGSVEFIDLKDENGVASGTKVVIKIPVEL